VKKWRRGNWNREKKKVEGKGNGKENKGKKSK
jgi:hypothetical protein